MEITQSARRFLSRAQALNGACQLDTSKADGQYRKPASNVKLLNLMTEGGGFEFTPFEQGESHVQVLKDIC